MCCSIVTGMSSGKSEGSHSGPYGAAVITSFCWFSGQRDPSVKFISCSSVWKAGKRASEGLVADDARALHLPVAGRVVHHGVVLRRAVVPDRHAVGLPAPAHLVLGDERLGHKRAEQVA